MKWKKLDQPGSDGWQLFLADFETKNGFKFTKHPRYFVDENLGAGTTDFLRQLKAKVTDVWEEGLVGKGDEHIWRFCQSEQRILLTHDDDFLDERLLARSMPAEQELSTSSGKGRLLQKERLK